MFQIWSACAIKLWEPHSHNHFREADGESCRRTFQVAGSERLASWSVWLWRLGWRLTDTSEKGVSEASNTQTLGPKGRTWGPARHAGGTQRVGKPLDQLVVSGRLKQSSIMRDTGELDWWKLWINTGEQIWRHRGTVCTHTHKSIGWTLESMWFSWGFELQKSDNK